jgi:ABC-type uncharacterized transport system ATPase subunit
VPQHDLLIGAARVADNLAFLDAGAPFFETAAARRTRVARLAKAFALELGDPDARVDTLPVGTRQRIEIAGALAGDPDVLVLDEPTAVLSPDETAALFTSLRARADAGGAVVLITHRLAEVFAGADRLTLMSRGRTVRTCETGDTTPAEIGGLLIAGADIRPSKHAAQRAANGMTSSLTLTDFAPNQSQAVRAESISFSLFPGELLVLLAIDGNGADTIARAIAGLEPFSGDVALGGVRLPAQGDPLAFRAAGGAFVPADRREEGLVSALSLAENLALPDPPGRWLLDRRAMFSHAEERLSALGVRASSPAASAGSLSGGNQQKLVLAREALPQPKVLLVGQPTRGVDIGAIEFIHGRLRAMRDAGGAVMVVSSELDEILALSDRVVVMNAGRIAGELPIEQCSEAALGRLMGGAH